MRTSARAPSSSARSSADPTRTWSALPRDSFGPIRRRSSCASIAPKATERACSEGKRRRILRVGKKFFARCRAMRLAGRPARFEAIRMSRSGRRPPSRRSRRVVSGRLEPAARARHSLPGPLRAARGLPLRAAARRPAAVRPRRGSLPSRSQRAVIKRKPPGTVEANRGAARSPGDAQLIVRKWFARTMRDPAFVARAVSFPHGFPGVPRGLASGGRPSRSDA